VGMGRWAYRRPIMPVAFILLFYFAIPISAVILLH